MSKEIGLIYPPCECKCVDVEIGSHDNNIAIDVSEYSIFDDYIKARVKAGLGDKISADKCIVPALRKLWDEGIVTHNSCCGHHKFKPNVAVDPQYVEKAVELGYEAYVVEAGNYSASLMPEYEKNTGLYNKYNVRKLGGKKVEDCVVLKFDDPIAKEALIVWAKCMNEAGYVHVCADVMKKLEENEEQ